MFLLLWKKSDSSGLVRRLSTPKNFVRTSEKNWQKPQTLLNHSHHLLRMNPLVRERASCLRLVTFMHSDQRRFVINSVCGSGGGGSRPASNSYSSVLTNRMKRYSGERPTSLLPAVTTHQRCLSSYWWRRREILNVFTDFLCFYLHLLRNKKTTLGLNCMFF